MIRFWRRWLLPVAGLACLLLLPAVAMAQGLAGTVVSIGDGDTIRLRQGERTITVRLACIDARGSAGRWIDGWMPLWWSRPSTRVLGHRVVPPEQLLLHTDQGSQYRAIDYGDLLKEHKIVSSMSVQGCCWDIAVMESFFATRR